MSKRAEEAALEAYPAIIREREAGMGGLTLPYDANTLPRKYFKEGYEQAEKDTLERAITWLIEHANKYIVNITERYPDAAFDVVVDRKCWVDLKKAMEEQK